MWDAAICIRDENTNSSEISFARGIDDKRHFFYFDGDDAQCEVFLEEDGITLFRQGEEHLTELFFHEKSYIKVTTEEGSIQFDVKVLAFQNIDDILSMRYLIGEDEKLLEIKFTGV